MWFPMQLGNLQDPQTSSARRMVRSSINKVMQQQSNQVITLMSTWHGLGAYVIGVVHRKYMSNDRFPHCSGLPHCVVAYCIDFLLQNLLRALSVVHHTHSVARSIFGAVNSYPHHPQPVMDTWCGFYTILHCNTFSTKHT
jgi:hypothetical protein